MRVEFVQAVLAAADREPSLIFLSGDLGFLALEPVREKLGARFVNAGVSEQNMVSMAASLAYRGFKPIVYSITPFAVLRPLEQLRNGVCMHNLGVTVVGNGGGYGYGIMGATHHALEDVAVMRTMPNMRIHVPITSEDVAAALDESLAAGQPRYIRLNLAAKVDFVEGAALRPLRQVRAGKVGVVLCLGPIVGQVMEAMKTLENAGEATPSVWALGQLPFGELPPALVEDIRAKGRLMVVEEHVAAGGAGEALAAAVLRTVDVPVRFRHIHALGYPSGRYGSQRWHQEESSLAGEGLASALRELCA